MKGEGEGRREEGGGKVREGEGIFFTGMLTNIRLFTLV